MKTIIKIGIWKILKLFYDNHNFALHLRDISRKVAMNEGSVSRHLNLLVKNNILKAKIDGNMKKFYLDSRQIAKIFPLYDYEKFESLPLLRKNAIKFYLQNLDEKPVLAVIFGSTAKGTFQKDSDIDILEIVNRRKENIKVRKYVEAQTGIRIQEFQILDKIFKDEIASKKDKIVYSAIETGFPIFNNKYYYEVLYE